MSFRRAISIRLEAGLRVTRIRVQRQPNVAGLAAYGTPNSTRADDFKTRSDMYSGKLDHQFTPWWTSNISYVHLATQEPSGDFYGNKGNYSSDGKLVRFNDATSFYNVLTVNPTTIVTVGYGFNRYYSVTLSLRPGLQHRFRLWWEWFWRGLCEPGAVAIWWEVYFSFDQSA